MSSEFEKQQRWQLALFGLVLWGIPSALVLIAIGVAWLLAGAPLPGGGGW
jgi:hypothetical protein